MSAGNRAEIDRVLLENTVDAKVDDEVLFTMPELETSFFKSLRAVAPLAGAFLFLFIINRFFAELVKDYSFVTVVGAFAVFLLSRYFVNKSIENDENIRKSEAVIVSKVFTDAFNVVN